MTPYVMTSENVRMPALIYGTAWKEQRTADLTEMALRAGFRGIDTACQPKHYNEAGVGEAIGRMRAQGVDRSELFVQTKFTPLAGHDPARVPYDPAAPIEEQVAQSFAVSQANLGTPYVDSLVLHSPLHPYPMLLRAWRAMEKLYRAGVARQLGISNCYDPQLLIRLYADADVKPAVVQNRFYAQSGYDRELRSWCRLRGIVYQSFWSLTANPHLLESREFFALTQKYDKTEAQILYRFLNHCGIVPLIGSTSPEHLREDLEIFDFELSVGEVAVLERLLESESA